MEALRILASRYARQMIGFALAAAGMQLSLTQQNPWLGNPWPFVLAPLGAGWAAAVWAREFGSPADPKPDWQAELLKFRTYWLGVVAFVAGCLVPIFIDAASRGWSDRNLFGLGIATIAGIVGAAMVVWETLRSRRED